MGKGKDIVECKGKHDEDDDFYGHMKVNVPKMKAVKTKIKTQRLIK